MECVNAVAPPECRCENKGAPAVDFVYVDAHLTDAVAVLNVCVKNKQVKTKIRPFKSRLNSKLRRVCRTTAGHDVICQKLEHPDMNPKLFKTTETTLVTPFKKWL